MGKNTPANLSRQIDADLPRWFLLPPIERAQAVIDWCQLHAVDTSSIMATPLARAMSKQPYWSQGPSNYLDMVRSIAAYLAVR